MALVHDIKFETVTQMIMEMTDVYLQFTPKEPIPTWWEPFKAWVEGKDINDLDALEKEIQKAEKTAAKERPAWWKDAEKQFKGAPSMKVLSIKTDPFDPEEEDDGEDVMASRQETDAEDEPEPEPEDETEDAEEDEEPEDDKKDDDS